MRSATIPGSMPAGASRCTRCSVSRRVWVIIVQDLLELSRLEAGTGDAEEAPVDVAGMLALMRREMLARSERPSEVTLEAETTHCCWARRPSCIQFSRT